MLIINLIIKIINNRMIININCILKFFIILIFVLEININEDVHRVKIIKIEFIWSR